MITNYHFDDLSYKNSYLVNDSFGEWQLATSLYPKGIYIVVVKNNDQNVWQQKLIIE